MFIDEAEFILKAGHGGPGKVSFFKHSQTGGPDGGNGGRGGDVYIKATSDLTALRNFTSVKTLEAENGEAGRSNKQIGKNGRDKEILLPVGSRLVELETGEIYELDQPNQVLLVCKGGIGGRGNSELANSRRTTPKFAQKGLPGEEKHFQIVLRLIADFGLIGLPNAGKSSLLNELTKTHVKIADYPFTTLEPNLGVLEGKILADIPGLIEGAHEGKGLGIKFLKHIEKTHILLHCLAADSDDLNRDYRTVRTELEEYGHGLEGKPEIILLTKTDLVAKKMLEDQLKKLKRFKTEVIPVSIHDWDQLESLRKKLLA